MESQLRQNSHSVVLWARYAFVRVRCGRSTQEPGGEIMSKWKSITVKLVPVISAGGLAALAAVLSATGKWG
jgi:hypothetical protein